MEGRLSEQKKVTDRCPPIEVNEEKQKKENKRKKKNSTNIEGLTI